MPAHIAKPRYLRTLISIMVLVSMAISLVPATAYAWKPSTHVYLAQEALLDALDDGKVTIYRVNYTTGEVLDKLGDYSVEPELLAALRTYPEQYRAGTLGPDAYPDILIGQQVIHPDVSSPSGSNSWLEYLWRAAQSEDGRVRAFVAGYLTHASGDMYGHTFINNYTGGEFELGENAIKHIVLEGYVGKRTPDTISPTGTVVTQENVSIEGVEDFIYRYMVDARPGSRLEQELLNGMKAKFNIPYAFSMLRTELQQEISSYYQQKVEYDRQSAEKLRAADNCSWRDFSCSARALEAEAGYIQAKKLAFIAANGPEVTYMEHWVDDIDSGLRAWPGVSHKIAKALVYNTEGADIAKAQEVADDYVKDHLLSMAGAPDAVGATLNLIDEVMRPIDFLRDAIAEMKRDLLNYLLKQAFGYDLDDIAKYLKNPETHFDEVMGAGSEGEKTNLAQFNKDVLKLADTGYQNPSERFDYNKLPAAYNTVTINRLILLSPAEINRLLSDLGSTQTLNDPNVMLGFLRSLDAGNQWHNHDQKLVFAWDCDTYTQLFMHQIGEQDGCPLTPISDTTASDTTASATPPSLINGTITTVAGNDTRGFSGDGGPATSASIASTFGLASDAAGNLYIAEEINRRVRMIDVNGTISTVAGNGSAGSSGDGGPAMSATFQGPMGVTVDDAGNIYIADMSANRIRKVDTNGMISTVAGNGVRGFSGDGGPATSASLQSPTDVAVDDAGNLYIVDASNHRIRMVDTNGMISTVVGSNQVLNNGALIAFSGDGGPATEAILNGPTGMAIDASGNLYIADSSNNRIRMVDANGTITTVAGNGTADFSGDGGPATDATLNYPSNVTVDSTGNLYIADTRNNRIRIVDVNGTISTVVGNGSVEFSGDGGPAINAGLNYPVSVTMDGAGNLYIGDLLNFRIRKVEP